MLYFGRFWLGRVGSWGRGHGSYESLKATSEPTSLHVTCLIQVDFGRVGGAWGGGAGWVQRRDRHEL